MEPDKKAIDVAAAALAVVERKIKWREAEAERLRNATIKVSTTMEHLRLHEACLADLYELRAVLSDLHEKHETALEPLSAPTPAPDDVEGLRAEVERLMRIAGWGGLAGDAPERLVLASEMFDGLRSCDKWIDVHRVIDDGRVIPESATAYVRADLAERLAAVPEGYIPVPIILPPLAVSEIKDVLAAHDCHSVQARPLWAALLQVAGGMSVEDQEALYISEEGRAPKPLGSSQTVPPTLKALLRDAWTVCGEWLALHARYVKADSLEEFAYQPWVEELRETLGRLRTQPRALVAVSEETLQRWREALGGFNRRDVPDTVAVRDEIAALLKPDDQLV